MTRSIVILANDPGTANYGFCVIRATIHGSRPNVRLEFAVLEHGLVRNTLRTLKNTRLLREELALYMSAMRKIKAKHAPVVWVAERYMTRGIKGVTIELVSVMIGSMLGRYHKQMRFRLIIAAEWKNQVNKLGDLKEFYKAMRPYKITPHQVDACLIGIYTAHKMVGLKGFEFLPSNIGELICTAPSLATR